MPGITLEWNPDCERLASDRTPFSLRAARAALTLRATVDDDQQLQRLRDLIREVVKLQEVTNQLIAELSDRLRRSERANKPPPRRERRKKPR
jgi:hypothetical protein